MKVQEYAGLASEQEDICVWRIKLADALAMVKDGRIADAKTIVGLLWLATKELG